ncbi:MAG: PqqD family peptide modification chaperone [Thioalkalivibrio sp.]|nr:PqqD family peptide modification chaperone [Thioalkalivibrio sp.]
MELVGPATRFRLAPGVRMEGFADGTAILFLPQAEETLSLNPTAALLCSYADGNHSLGEVLSQMQDLFPDANPLLADFVACGQELAARGFLHWL